uniref:Uncharacterized protein n=1 Tax=Meloidogyne enterolobii TaxID=390850 RepID=A0A6V7UZ97_MELEN|nr:unnamed protein product [Meloidogyne enterolobii]
MNLSNFVIFLLFMFNLFNLTFCVKGLGESSNPNQNYQQPNWDAPPGFTSHSRATAQTGAQRGSANVVPHTTTARQYSNLLQQNVQPVILAPRQDIQSSSRSIRTLYEGQERASNFDFFANGGEIRFGGQSDGADNNMISFTQHGNFNSMLKILQYFKLFKIIRKIPH